MITGFGVMLYGTVFYMSGWWLGWFVGFIADWRIRLAKKGQARHTEEVRVED